MSNPPASTSCMLGLQHAPLHLMLALGVWSVCCIYVRPSAHGGTGVSSIAPALFSLPRCALSVNHSSLAGQCWESISDPVQGSQTCGMDPDSSRDSVVNLGSLLLHPKHFTNETTSPALGLIQPRPTQTSKQAKMDIRLLISLPPLPKCRDGKHAHRVTGGCGTSSAGTRSCYLPRCTPSLCLHEIKLKPESHQHR